MSFPCTACGLCCQHISGIEELVTYDRGDGVCKFYDEKHNNCTVYETRPAICRVDEMYDRVYKDAFPDRRTFYIANAEICNRLQAQHGLDKSYMVKL